ncbi:MAG TPA: aminotransferase class V-fold PLP-dependent enzyme [Longimicrobiales bacterium]|nr:aminotransferase class V-fold PLP-dependent enzyme [Longimicrobiales bacterium]
MRVEALMMAEFEALAGTCYLNTASSGVLPERSRAALEDALRRRSAGRLTEQDFTPALSRARAAAARLLSAAVDEIALVPNTSVGLNLAASFLLQRRAEGDDRPAIVVSDREFPANVYPWLELERSGFRVEVVPCDAFGRPDEDALCARIDRDDVALFALSAVQFATGWSADLPRFGEICRGRQIFFSVDAIQGAGVVPLAPRAAHVDLLTAGGQKWLCAPWGTGFVWVRREHITRLRPLHTGWLAYSATQDFATLTSYDRDLLDDARRFEVGSLPYPEMLALAHSIEVILEAGVENIRAHVRALHQPLIEWAAHRGVLSLLDDAHASGILCLRTPAADHAFAALQQAGVQCATREGVLRISPHLYNSSDDIDRVIETLDRVIPE